MNSLESHGRCRLERSALIKPPRRVPLRRGGTGQPAATTSGSMGVRLFGVVPCPGCGFLVRRRGVGALGCDGLRGVRRGCGWGAVGEGQAVSVRLRRGRGWWAGVLEFFGCWRVRSPAMAVIYSCALSALPLGTVKRSGRLSSTPKSVSSSTSDARIPGASQV